MADSITDKIVNAFHAMGVFGNNAYSRKGRIPMEISRDPGPEVTGMTWMRDPSQITVNAPMGTNPESIADTIKHELVHASFIGGQVPQQSDFKTKLLQAPIGVASISSPINNYNWDYNGRSGTPKDELPAYMSIYKPDQTPYISSGVRDQYMEELMAFLKKSGQQKVADKVTELMKGREAYSGTGLFPKQNVGEGY